MGPTVLIVDDHLPFRSAASALLRADGFDVVGHARDGAEGLGASRALGPDLVLVDVRLPDADGFAVARALVDAEDAPAVVMTSSSDDPLYPERARRAGARGFVCKHDLNGAVLRSLVDGTTGMEHSRRARRHRR